MKGLFAFGLGILSLTVASLMACRPAADDNDPKNLIWDENAREGFNKVLKLKTVDGIRVMFWNIAYGSLNGAFDIDHNLLELAHSNLRPDVIVLCEYKPIAIASKTLETLKTEYPFNTWYVYGKGLSEIGIGVFSTYQFTQTEPKFMDWVPTSGTTEQKEAYRAAWEARAPKQSSWWNRSYSKFQWDLAGFKMNLVPVHMLEPWDEVRNYRGKAGTMWNMLFSNDNPLHYQIERLLAFIKQDMGGDIDSEPLLLIGDMNTPKSALGINTVAYNLLDADLDDVFPGTPPTFPAFSAESRQQPPFTYSLVKIDHAFHNKKVQPLAAAALTLRGSDHYPIYVIVQPTR